MLLLLLLLLHTGRGQDAIPREYVNRSSGAEQVEYNFACLSHVPQRRYRGGQASAGALCAELYGLAQLDGALVERAGAFQQAQLHAAVAAHSSTPTLRQPAAPAVATQLHAVSTLSSQLRAAVVARVAGSFIGTTHPASASGNCLRGADSLAGRAFPVLGKLASFFCCRSVELIPALTGRPRRGAATRWAARSAR